MFLITTSAWADFIVAPGVVANSAFRSEEKDSHNQNVLKSNGGAGLEGNFELIFLKVLTLNMGAAYTAGSAKTQYNYTNASNPSQTAQVADLEAATNQISAFAGPRLRFISTKRLKVFGGGGVITGALNLTYNEDKFTEATGNKNGFKDHEALPFNGSYYEGGFEYILNNKGGLRFLVRNVTHKSKKYETLGNSRITSHYLQFGIQYIHYVNWKFFWR